ncbi:MAG: hypothetical protein JWP61_2078 [Friedmanniella sp.]|nr:hypothetical protein [Friedmanniella sp.]
MTRVARALGAWLVLLAGLVAVPGALVWVGSRLGLEGLAGRAGWRALLRPDDGTVLAGVLLVVAWCAWLIFTLSVLAQVATVVSGQRVSLRLPGLAGPQQLVAGLVLTALTLVTAPAVGAGTADLSGLVGQSKPGEGARHTGSRPAVTEPALTSSPEPASLDQKPDKPLVPARRPASPAFPAGERPEPSVSPVLPPAEVVTTAAPATGSAWSPGLVHRVQEGDDLWSLATRYLGNGLEWRRIAAANPARLSGGPDRLEPGWELLIPGARGSAPAGGPGVRVRAGDSLSSLAGHFLGDVDRWPELWHLNRSLLTDPDELPVGLELRLPSPQQHSRATADRGGSPRVEHRGPPSPEGGLQAGSPSAVPRDPSAGRSEGNRSQTGEAAGGGGSTPSAATSPAAGPENPRPPATGHRATGVPTAGDWTSGGGRAHAPAPGGVSAGDPAPAEGRAAGGQAGGPTTAGPPSTAVAPSRASSAEPAWLLPLSSVGGLLASGLVAGLRLRRRRQLQARPVGRRLPAAGPQLQPVTAAAVRRAQPLGLRALDRATRAAAAHCLTHNRPLPALRWATVSEDQVELWWNEAVPDPPVGFTSEGPVWRLNNMDVHYLSSVPGLGETPRPWPALVTLGHDIEGRLLVVDLEGLGLLRVAGADPAVGVGVLAALGLELAFAPWAEEMTLTVVGPTGGLVAALDHPNVSRADSLDRVLDRLERWASEHPIEPAAASAAQRRLDAELGDSWAPHVVLVAEPLTGAQRSRLLALTSGDRCLPLAAVVCDPLMAAPYSLTTSAPDDLGDSDDPDDPDDPDIGHAWFAQSAQGSGPPSPPVRITPQILSLPERAAVVELLEVTGSAETTSAPWWAELTAVPDRPPDDQPVIGRRFGGWDESEPEGEEVDMRFEPSAVSPESISGPVLRLIGPVELVGAAGPPPSRAARQCLEYCAWLLEHPQTTSPAMANALIVAEGTRRSNMSRLRTWLGESPDGEPYLPDAYTGKIRLHPSVSSDWQQVQILTAGGINRAATDALQAALGLVRGAPLADAAPGQWYWAEELRTDMISCLRDLGVELARRGLEAGDLDLARWAASRALVAAPGDELLLLARVRTEHRAGNGAAAERLTLQLAAQARSLGVDLADETIAALQEVMEGRVRARTA